MPDGTPINPYASLRIAHYFRRWERARRKVILCLPRRAGLMRHVYVVADL